MSSFTNFNISGNQINLVLPKEKYAPKLFKVINADRKELALWLPWVNKTKNVNDERLALKNFKGENVDHKALTLIIVSQSNPIGMVDLHNIDATNRTGEIGYWLYSKYQGKGIITRALKLLAQKAFYDLNLHKILAFIVTKNHKSRAICQRLNFFQEAVLKEQFYRNGKFLDVDVYSLFSNK